MAIETLAATAVAILAPYLADGAKSFATKAGSLLAEKSGGIYQAIKNKFAGDTDAQQTLAQVETMPNSKPRQAALEEVLSERITSDDTFRELMSTLIAEAKAADTNRILNIFGDGNITVGGDASKNIFITGDNNQVKKS